MGSVDSHFAVSVGSDGQSHKTASGQTTTFLKSKESRSGIEPRSSAYQPNVLPLGQTGSQFRHLQRVTSAGTSHTRSRLHGLKILYICALDLGQDWGGVYGGWGGVSGGRPRAETETGNWILVFSGTVITSKKNE